MYFGKIKKLGLSDGHCFDKNQRSVTLVSNTAEHVQTLDYISKRAHQMFASRAYVHHYKKFGLEEQQIVNLLTKFEGVVKRYKECKRGN